MKKREEGPNKECFQRFAYTVLKEMETERKEERRRNKKGEFKKWTRNENRTVFILILTNLMH